MSTTITSSKVYVRGPGLRPVPLQDILEGKTPGVTAEVDETPTGAPVITVSWVEDKGGVLPFPRQQVLSVTPFVWEQARYFLASARFAAYLRSMTPEERQVVGFSA